jgi:hypothetical protein
MGTARAGAARSEIGPFGFGLLTAAVLILLLFTLLPVAGMMAAPNMPTTQGHLVGVRENHRGSVRYLPEIAYQVDGRDYRVDSLDSIGGSKSDVPPIGTELTVRYVPSSPRYARWDGARASVTQDTVTYMVIFGGATLFMFLLWLIVLRGRRRDESIGLLAKHPVIVLASGVAVAGLGVWWLSGTYANPGVLLNIPTPNVAAAALVSLGVGGVCGGVRGLRAAREPANR